MSRFRENNNPRKKSTKGFSELNKRTYEASQTGRAERQQATNNAAVNQQPFNGGTNQRPANNNVANQRPVNNGANQQPFNNAANQRPVNNGAAYNGNQGQNNFNARQNQGNNQQYLGFTPNNLPNDGWGNQTPRGENQNFPYGNQNNQTHARKRNTQNMDGAFNPVKNQQYIPNTDGYSRDSFGSKYNEQIRKAKKKKKIILIIVAALIAVLAIGGVAFAAVVGNIFGNLNEGMDDIGLVKTPYADSPFYMVLMGIDSSDERKEEDGGTDEDYRSDSMILARVDAKEQKVSLISLHRDTLVDMGEYGQQKLNAAHSLGGPELVIKTVSKLAGVDINHYAEINFDGFKQAVNDLGGVEVNVPMAIEDYLAGGAVAAGQQTLNGDEALVLCRARHAYDDYGDGDRYRAANQRMVLSAIAKKAMDSDLGTITKLATDLSQYIKTDFKLDDIVGLAQAFKGIDVEKNVWSAMMPTTPQMIDDIWYEILDEDKWTTMMKRMDQGLPPSTETVIDDETGTVLSYSGSDNSSGGNLSGTVAVRNGTSREGKAAEAATKIKELGFSTNVGNATTQDFKETIIVYKNENQKSNAEAIKEKLGKGTVVMDTNNEYSFDAEVLVVVGSDY